MARYRTDWILFVTILAMTAFGIVMVYSASSASAKLYYHVEPYSFVLKQVAFVGASFLVLMYFKRLDYSTLNTPAWAFSGLGIVLGMLVLVYFVDPQHRWLRIPGVGELQPSEFAKPALCLFLAYFISRRTHSINDPKTLQQAVAAVAMLGMLVVVADLGTAMVPVITGVIVFWVAGLEWKYMVRVAAVGILLAALAIIWQPYRLGRVIGYIDPDYSKIEMIDTHHVIHDYVQRHTVIRDPTYQSRQSRIAVGTGGVFGVGLMQSRQKLMFLPQAHTDFIYAVVGEELGLWGSTAVLFGFVVVLWRGARLFLIARDDFGKYLALSVTITIILQAFLNITVVLDLVPTKGFPLPMISYGGSSLLSTLASLGMLLSVSEHEN
jgi:cell division protein FtsW